jgi:hypothetical protein
MATPPRASPIPDPGAGEEVGTEGELAAAAGITGERWRWRLKLCPRQLGTDASLRRKREEVPVERVAGGGRERRGSEAAVVTAMARWGRGKTGVLGELEMVCRWRVWPQICEEECASFLL